ncbi:MAG TPA: hypothetical protein VI854_00025 [Acidimicrobiia bacterium]|nr:hypothetical protein [Acidimicrobiia bacterium]
MLAAASAVLAACSRDRSAGPAAPDTAPTKGSTGRAETAPTTATTGTGAAALAPTPACDDDEPTPAQTEGPYFTANSPERADLRGGGVTGSALSLSGLVVTTSCRPLARALVDFWQADGDGDYDNEGYRLRGHQYTDDEGRWRLETVMPGLYPGRTRHIHVKVQAPGQRVLTTQLYFPGEAQNARDRIYRPECLVALGGSPGGVRQGTFTFVLAG